MSSRYVENKETEAQVFRDLPRKEEQTSST